MIPETLHHAGNGLVKYSTSGAIIAPFNDIHGEGDIIPLRYEFVCGLPKLRQILCDVQEAINFLENK